MTPDSAQPGSKYAQALLRGQPLGLQIVDCHGHMDAYARHYVPRSGSAEAMVELMDRLGIATLCLSHHLSIGPDCGSGNRIACDAAARHRGRLLVYLGFNPNHPLKHGMDELALLVANPAVIGIKLHPAHHQAAPDDPRYDPVFELARSKGFLMLVHTWGVPDIKGIERMARRHPGIPIIMGHSGGYEFTANEEAIRAARENDTLYLDLTLSGMFEGVVETFVREAGIEKVLFGSDMPFFDPRPNIGRVLFARISDPQKERVLGRTMKELLGARGLGGEVTSQGDVT